MKNVIRSCAMPRSEYEEMQRWLFSRHQQMGDPILERQDNGDLYYRVVAEIDDTLVRSFKSVWC